MLDIYSKIYFGVIHITIFVILLCALSLWLQRSKGERSRRILSWVWLGCGMMLLVRLLLFYQDYVVSSDIVLDIRALIGGFFSIAILFLYPVEIITPRWLNIKRLLLLLSPVIITAAVVVMMQLCGVEFRALYNLNDIAQYWYEGNVLIRFVVVLEIFSYSFIVFFIPHNKVRSNTTLTWVYSYVIGVQGISILYFGNMFFGLIPTGIFHHLYTIGFICYITYQELFLRLFIVPSQLEDATTLDVQQFPATEPIEAADNRELDPLFHKLEQYMEQQQAWTNPNLSLPILAEALHTNRTTLSHTLREAGYDFYDYIAAYRIRAFCSAVEQGKVISIQAAFFEVGFRSRATAFNQFKKQMGITPSDYLKSIPKRD
ncbi:MAG: helix-turn-helix domain-containing protein [Parabacteroides sp.]|nr:helix-turn-helix domain-containing protein [Parabacteroides sp.]